MKIILKESQVKFLIKEYINPEEAHNDVDSVRLICEGKRGVAFVTASRLNEYEQIVEMVSECELDSFKVPNNIHDAYIVFNENHRDEAKELLDIAISLDGYLSPKAPEDVTRRIGEILNYDPQEVEKFINDKNINESETSTSIEMGFNDFTTKYPKQIKNANSLVNMNGILNFTKDYLINNVPNVTQNNVQPKDFLNQYYSLLYKKFTENEIGWAKRKMLKTVLGNVKKAPQTLDTWVFKDIIWNLLLLAANSPDVNWNENYRNMVLNNKMPLYQKIRDSLIAKIYS